MMKRLGTSLVLAVACLLAAAPSARADHVFFCFLDGGQENPPVDTASWGFGIFILSDDLTRLDFLISYTELEGTAVSGAHFHVAPFGMNGGVVRGYNNADFSLDGGNFQNAWTNRDGNQPLTPARVESLFNFDVYFNIHTMPNHGGGLIRGQVGYVFSY